MRDLDNPLIGSRPPKIPCFGRFHRIIPGTSSVKASSRVATETVDTLAGLVHIHCDDAVSHPFWTTTSSGGPIKVDPSRPANLIACQNGLIDYGGAGNWGTGTGGPVVLPHSSDFFTMAAVPYIFNPAATCERWLEFLDWFTCKDVV